MISRHSGLSGRIGLAGVVALAAALLGWTLATPALATTGDVQIAPKTQGKQEHPTVPGILSLDLVNKLLKVEQNLSKTGPRDVNLDMSMALNGTPDSFQQWKARLESNPQTAEAILSGGMNTQQYLTTYATIVRAAAISHANKSGTKIPEGLRRQIAEADVAFVEAHSAEIGRIARPGPATITPNTMEDIYVADDSGKDATKAPAKAADTAAPPKADPKKEDSKKSAVKKP